MFEQYIKTVNDNNYCNRHNYSMLQPHALIRNPHIYKDKPQNHHTFCMVLSYVIFNFYSFLSYLVELVTFYAIV